MLDFLEELQTKNLNSYGQYKGRNKKSNRLAESC